MKKIALKMISIVLVGIFMISGCGEGNTKNKKTVSSGLSATIEDKGAVSSLEGVTFSALNPGEIQAERWLKNQLTLLAENMATDFEKISPTVKTEGPDRSGWLGGTGENWERGPYYIRGLVSLAYTLNNDSLKKQAQKWIDWTLSSQVESGAFGPCANDMQNFDYWAVMPMLMALEEYYDATGDERVTSFLQKYFKFESENLKRKSLGSGSWAYWRACDNIYAVWWLWQKTGDDSLKDLCKTLEAQGCNWSTTYRDDIFDIKKNYHIVNIHQGLKLYPTLYALTGKEGYLNSYYEGLESLYLSSGRQDGMSNGDEKLRGNSATYGIEACAVAERIVSDKIALRFTKDATVADSLENVAYNCLPQQLLPDGRGYAYFTMQNQIDATKGSKGFTTEYGTALCYGTPSGCPCCAHNYLMAWPEFVQSKWMKTSDNGLAVGAYGPNTITTELDGKGKITITEETNYPYEENVKLTVNPENGSVECPIYLRTPEWCANATLKINGKVQKDTLVAGEYIKLAQKWNKGDVIELTFPMEFKTTLTQNNSVSIKYGAVLFAVKIEENWQKIIYTSHYNKDYNYLGGKYSNYNITAASDWNYALADFNFDDIKSNFTILKSPISDNMRYIQSEAPIILTANGVKVNNWVAGSNNVANEVPVSPVQSGNLGARAKITLIPYAFSRLRIAFIPWTGSGTVEYSPNKSTSAQGSLKISGIIVPNEGGIRQDKTSFLMAYHSDKDFYVKIYINKKEYSQMLRFEKGDNTVEISYPNENCFEKNNLIELKTVDGKAFSKEFNISVTVG